MKARAPGPTSRAPEVSGKLKAPRADRERRTALRATVGDSRGTVGERELQAMCLPLLLPLVLLLGPLVLLLLLRLPAVLRLL